MLQLTSADRLRIETIIKDVNVTLDQQSLSLQSGKLCFAVKGDDGQGALAIKALIEAGLNTAFDEDPNTVENTSSWHEGAATAQVAMTLKNSDNLWRD